MKSELRFYQGNILNPKSDQVCDYYPRGVLVAKKKNNQWMIHDLLNHDEAMAKYPQFANNDKNYLDFGQSLIMPGFFDMHFHWVQDDVREMPKDSLLEWLEKYTFPTEAKFKKKSFSSQKAKSFFKDLFFQGTFGGAVYSSIHAHTVDHAFKYAKGDFIIGNVAMNMNSPKELTQTPKESLQIAKDHMKKYGKKYCFTPRFAITTTPYVMKKGSELSQKFGCFIQTHLSETQNEIDYVLSLYKDLRKNENKKIKEKQFSSLLQYPSKKIKTYTDIYHQFGMLGKKTLMGHGIHLTPQELKILARTKTVLIHCPTSNAPHKELGLESGLFDFRQVEKHGVRWALGSDIGGGPFVSMFDVMRSFVHQNQKNKMTEATYTKALYRSTLAGAEILEKDHIVGNLDVGKKLNFLVIPLDAKRVPSTPEALLKRVILRHQKTRSKYRELISQICFEGTLTKRSK